jgi:hypothetical protein
MITKDMLEIPMLNHTVFVWMTDSNDINDIKNDPDFPESLNETTLGTASTLIGYDSDLVVILLKIDSSVLTVLHESIHAYTAVLELRDIQTDIAVNDEWYAYTLSWFQREILYLVETIRLRIQDEKNKAKPKKKVVKAKKK